MMQLVAPEKEPITPFVRIVRSLYEDCNISSILVIGGVGDYFSYHISAKSDRACLILIPDRVNLKVTILAGKRPLG